VIWEFIPGPGPANYILALECMKQKRVTHIHVRHSDTREEIRRAERQPSGCISALKRGRSRKEARSGSDSY